MAKEKEFFKTESFEGFLYDDFGIGPEFKKLGEVIKILESKGFIVDKEDSSSLLNFIGVEDDEENDEYDEENDIKSLYLEQFVKASYDNSEVCGIPAALMFLITDYFQQDYLGNAVIYNYKDENEKNKIISLLDDIVSKYGFKEIEFNNNEILDGCFFKIPATDFWGNYYHYKDGREYRYLWVLIEETCIVICSLFDALDTGVQGYFMPHGILNVIHKAAEKFWGKCVILSTTERYEAKLNYDDEETFKRLLDKWEEILSRPDAKNKIKIRKNSTLNTKDIQKHNDVELCNMEYVSEKGLKLSFVAFMDVKDYSASWWKTSINLEAKNEKTSMKGEVEVSFPNLSGAKDKLYLKLSLESVFEHLGKSEMYQKYRDLLFGTEEEQAKKKARARRKVIQRTEKKIKEKELKEKEEGEALAEMNNELDDL